MLGGADGIAGESGGSGVRVGGVSLETREGDAPPERGSEAEEVSLVGLEPKREGQRDAFAAAVRNPGRRGPVAVWRIWEPSHGGRDARELQEGRRWPWVKDFGATGHGWEARHEGATSTWEYLH